jgi:hypothetical protein
MLQVPWIRSGNGLKGLVASPLHKIILYPMILDHALKDAGHPKFSSLTCRKERAQFAHILDVL